jgi:hypothetical protein
MIVYTLQCQNAHKFEGWFASPEAFLHQHEAGQLTCPVCGSSSVEKQLSAPYLQMRSGTASSSDTVMASQEMLEQVRKKVVDYILRNTEDVGERFADEARAIFYDQAPERSIRGKASAAETRELIDEGIDVFAMPMPPVPPDQLH